MKTKRFLAALLCAVLLLSSVPFASFSPFGGAFVAQAANMNDLQALVNSVRPVNQWHIYYVDATGLDEPYNNALSVLEKTNASQTEIDTAYAKLKLVLDSIQYHTIGLAVNPREANCAVGSSVTLSVTKEPSNAVDPVSWVSKNPAVADVDSNGKVTVKQFSAESVLISAVSNGTSSSCTLHIINPATGVKLSQTSASVLVGKELTLTAEAVGADAASPVSERIEATSWHSDNTSVASVSDKGVVKGLSAGVATITVTASAAGKQFTANCVVTVGRLVTITAITPVSVAVGGTLTTSLGATETVTVKVEPSNASEKNLTWTSSDTAVATVGESKIDGAQVSAKITAHKEGTARITYTAGDGSGQSGYFTLKVNPAVSFIQISPEKLVISPTATNQKVTAKILPENAGNQVVTWKSSNENVCEVNYSGVLSPKMLGTCTITATTTDGSGLSGSCFVRVADPASAVSIDQSSLNMNVGETTALKATVRTTSGTAYSDVEWVSSNASVVTVDSNGKVEAVGTGTTNILAVTLDGTEKSAVCAVSVTAVLERIELESSVDVDLNGTVTLSPVFIPAYASDKAVTWSTSDKTIATVNSKGVVTGKKTGSVTITCTGSNGVKATCTVNVVTPVTGVTISETSLSLNAGESRTLTAAVAPENATDKRLTWTSSDESVATVSANGLVKAIAGGQCTITVTSASGGKVASCALSVRQGVSSLHFEQARATMYETETITLTPVITPATATETDLNWTTSNAEVANVNAVGIVTARTPGTAVITAATKDGSHSDSVTITVNKMVPVTGIYIPYNTVALMAGNTYTISANVYPSNASNKNIIWSSNDTSVAAVFDGGEVSANGPGTAVITATTVDGGYSYRCKVTVTQAVEGIKLSKTKLNVPVGSSKTLTATFVPANASNKNVSWYCADTNIATVNSKGIVSGKKPGTTTVTVMAEEGSFSASCTVVVYTPETGIKINSKKLTLGKGAKALLTATITPADATNKNVEWSSSDPSVCSVNASGQLAGLKLGSAVITAKTSDGKYKDTCLVEVVQLATEVALDYTNLQLDVGKTKTLSATLRPLTITNKKVKWSSSDKTVATVSSTGTVKALKAGTTTIKCASADGGAKTTCKVTVIQRVNSIKFNDSKPTVKVGESKVLAVTKLPADASETTFLWKSSDKKIAKVNAKGKVVGVAPGTCVIKVSNAAGTVKAKCTLTVTLGVKSLSLDKSAVSISKGKSTTLRAIFSPKNASNQKVTWTSSNNDVATVDKQGRITAKDIGYAVITATAKDGGATASCKVRVVYGVRGISLDQSKITLVAGQKQALKATITPSNASNQNVIWKSSNKNVARVTSAGVVKAVRAGNVKISVTTADGGYKAVCKVTVIVHTTGVTLNRTKLTLEKDKRFNLKANVSPADASNKTVTWSSSNPAVAVVNKNGVVKAVGAGTAIITARTKDGGYKAVCKINVRVSPASVKLNKSKLTLGEGKTETLQAQVLPSDAPQTVTWSSSNTKIVGVSQTGLIRGRSAGSAVITATADNGKSASCIVTVQEMLTELTLNKNALSLTPGQTATLKASAAPANLANGALTWQTSDDKIVTVNAKGTLTAVAPGKATVTVSNAASGLSDTCTVTVRRAVTGVSLNRTALSLSYRETATLQAIVAPQNATNKAVVWNSSDTSIAKVTKKGVVTAVGSGTATITAVTDDGSFTAACKVTVTVPVTGISLSAPAGTLNVGNTLALQGATVPAFASNPAITFASSDEAVAKVSAKGVVTGIKAGVVTITAKTAEGGYAKTVSLTVIEPVTAIRFDSGDYSMTPGSTLTLSPVVLPQSAADKSLTWKSADPSIAAVDAQGKVKAIAPGETKITAVSNNSGVSSDVSVRVISPNN